MRDTHGGKQQNAYTQEEKEAILSTNYLQVSVIKSETQS